jgi:DUF438 domain-containing protein
MELKEIQSLILDAIPHPIVFVHTQHTIRYLNKRARYHYYEERADTDLVGKSLFECHSEASRKKIQQLVEGFENHGQEVFLKVNVRNERIYITPVRDKNGDLVGYFERFEHNFTKT